MTKLNLNNGTTEHCETEFCPCDAEIQWFEPEMVSISKETNTPYGTSGFPKAENLRVEPLFFYMMIWRIFAFGTDLMATILNLQIRQIC